MSSDAAAWLNCKLREGDASYSALFVPTKGARRLSFHCFQPPLHSTRRCDAKFRSPPSPALLPARSILSLSSPERCVPTPTGNHFNFHINMYLCGNVAAPSGISQSILSPLLSTLTRIHAARNPREPKKYVIFQLFFLFTF